MSLVYDLFNELQTFMRIIRENVEASCDATCLSKLYKLPLTRKRKDRTPADNYVSTDMGLVFEIGGTDAGDDEDSDSDEVEDSDSDSSSKGMQISPDNQYLCFRIILHDHKAGSAEAFTPSVVGALLTDVYRTSTAKGKQTKELREFSIRRVGFQRLVRQLNGSQSPGNEVSNPITRGTIFANVAKQVSAPLASFGTEESIADFVQQVLPDEPV